MGASGGRKGFSEINITPLVDVVLVLLVVFMVTAPLLATGLRVELPQVNADPVPLPDTQLVITVTKAGRVVFGEQDVTSNLEDVLLNDVHIQTERQVYVRAHKDARYGDVARVVAAARAAGVDGINLLVEPDLRPDADPEQEEP